jgi:enoyl-CoA hydratase
MANGVDVESAPEVLCERRGAAGVITLNRPQALNAITHAMVRDIRRALDMWAGDPAVTRIVVRGVGERAFCAGGDIRHLFELGVAGRQEEALTFWRDEYALNILIKSYPKPYLSLIDGIVMGGGVGISLHGSHRVAGDRYAFAMPEVGIGFFPDVGATYALPRLPGGTGTYIALTGDRVRAADALALGLATHAVPSGDHPALLEALVAGEEAEAALARFSRHPGEAPLTPSRAVIDACFAADSVAGILERLEAASGPGSEFAAKTAGTIRTKSPMSLAIAYEQMRRGGALSFEEAMATEFRIVSRVVHGHDFYEGVRAAIIEKDGAPRWRPASLAEVSREEVERYFVPLGLAELEVPRS